MWLFSSLISRGVDDELTFVNDAFVSVLFCHDIDDELTFVNNAFVSVLFSHDVDDEAADFEKSQHLVKCVNFQMRFAETTRDHDHIVRILKMGYGTHAGYGC